MNSVFHRTLPAAVFAAVSACAPSPPRQPSPAAYDVVIENARIVDGTGAAWYYGDLAIRGDRIARIAPRGMLRGAAARERLDVRGMVVAPGFIDIQSHSRGAFLGNGDGRVVSKVSMGVTTEIMGEGSTNAIINARMLGADSASEAGRRQLARYCGPEGFANWLADMQTHGASVNVASFLGGDNVRTYARGASAGAPTPAELDTMRKVVPGRWKVARSALQPP
jgi:N-acyl-D-amino-acid deacylase